MRYEVREVPYGNTPSPDANAKWTVVDTKPECEAFETRMGAELVEEQAPAWRNVAFCMKRGHADMVAGALNATWMYLSNPSNGNDWVRRRFTGKDNV